MWKLRVGVEHYYLSQVAGGLDDYYTGRGEAAGRWLGAASSGLGLERGDEVTPEALQAVLAGLRPGTGLTPDGTQLRTWRNRVPGFDLTFSAPKSVSALYALGDPLVAGQVVEACDAAVEAALAWLEREACFVRRGSNNRAAAPGTPSSEWGTRRLAGAGFVAAGFRHRTSRAGDPQLHTHVLVANITRGPDQRWTALDGQPLYRSKHAAGSVYQAVLRGELTRRLGIEWCPVHKGTAEVAGIPRRLLRLWSKRREAIETELAATGQTGPAAADAAALATRPSKELTDITTLRDSWLAEADAVGFGPHDIDHLLGNLPIHADQQPADVACDLDADTSRASFLDQIAAAMTEVDSTCTRHQITELVAAALPHGTTAAALERLTHWVLTQPELVPIPSPEPHHHGAPGGWEQRWTTRTLLAMERDLIAAYTDTTPTALIDPTLVEHHLTTGGSLGDDQAAAVRTIAASSRPVNVIVGRAGTGKTCTLNSLRRLFLHAGYTVVGAAPSARAARELADGAGIDATTFPRFTNRHLDHVTRSHVVVIDEAGMANTRDLHHLVTRARRAGAKVILVGDHHQLPEVAAGGGFAIAVHTLGSQAAELTVNRRQTAEWEHDALAELRHGNVAAGFRSYLDHDRVVLTEHPAQAQQAAVDAWLSSHRAGRHAILLAGTRNEARTLNRLARQHLADHLHGPVVELDDCCFQAGDRIVLLRNSPDHTDVDTGQPCWVDNGTIATITTVHPDDQLDIECLNGRHIRLTASYVHAGHVDHGYATTIHKAQGLTCDQMMLVGPNGLYREAVYVAMSRARHGSWIYATTRQASELADQPHTHGIPLPTEHPDDPAHDLTTAIETSRAKTFATTQADHLDAINTLAHAAPLDVLQQRHTHIRTVTRRLLAAGHTDPTEPAARLARARQTRLRLHVGGRVNAADWDNVGAITAIFDLTGTALVTFTSSDGQRTATKTLPWSDLTPLEQPEPADSTADANDYFALAARSVDELTATWLTAFAEHGIGPDEPAIVAGAIEQRRQLVTHALAAQPPDWLTWWLGHRPTDPAGATTWDTELAHLAIWRDTHHLPTNTPGYGPPPDTPNDQDQWCDHLERSLATRAWLADHTPNLPTPEPAIVDIAAVRERLRELDALVASAPADQSRIIADLTAGDLSPADIHRALTTAADTQGSRRQWILEHWPHIVERAELARIDRELDPLAHWPTPLDPAVQRLLDELRAISTDTPEPSTLPELDALLDAANPHHHLTQLARRQDDTRNHINALTLERADATPARAELIDQHITYLRGKLDRLEREWRQHDHAINLWDIGSRPPDLQDALLRRANHLAHKSIANGESWLVRFIAEWADPHPAFDASGLQRLIFDLAATRERHAIRRCASQPERLVEPSTGTSHHYRARLVQTFEPEGKGLIT